MTTPAPAQPLWRVMRTAYEDAYDNAIMGNSDTAERIAYAAELRAVADYLVPACDCPNGGIESRAMWLARQRIRERIRDRLLDEADWAEAGE